MPEITVDVVEEMPESARVGRKGKWTDLIAVAAADGKPRTLRGIPAEDMEAVRRQLSHTASSIDKGVQTVVKDGVLYFQVGDKRRGPTAPANGSTATPAEGGSVTGDGSSTPVPAAASPGAAAGSPRSRK